MSPITPVGPRVPKDEFMKALQLDTNNPQHEGLYRAMRVSIPEFVSFIVDADYVE
jgi:hypothetical protein